MLVNSNILKRIDSDFELKMGGYIIERTKTYLYLGLLVDDKFSWESHVSEVCCKLSQIAGIVLKFRSLLTKKAMLLLYHALVGSTGGVGSELHRGKVVQSVVRDKISI